MPPALLVSLALLHAVVGAPSLYRVLGPVSLNDTVTFAGSFGGPVSAVSFCDSTGFCQTSPLSVPSSSTVRATVPSSLDPGSTFNATLLGASGEDVLSAIVNAPEVTWWQGEGAWPSQGGADALVGRKVRLIGSSLGWAGGRCLPFSRAATPPPVRVEAVELSSGTIVPLPVTFASCYRVEAMVPPSVQLGVPYALRLDSGLKGPGIPPGGAATVVPRLVFGPPGDGWPPAMFYLNVTGAATPSPNCNTVPQCLATAGAAGGGTVVFPPGTFPLCNNWVFPDRVALVGAGRGKTLVQWPTTCQTASLFYPNLNANTAKALPVISGQPGARWRLEDMDLHCQAKAALGYQPTLGTNFIGLGIASDLYNAGAGGYGGSSARLARLNITYDLRLFPGVQIGNALAVYSSADFSLVDSYVSHRGNCAAQWPHNCIYHITNSSNGEVRGVEFDMGCQAAAHESSSRLFLADNVYREAQSWEGQRSTTGGFEFSNIDPPHVSQLHYLGNVSYTGNPLSAERWESFTTDGGADCVYNDTVLGQATNPDGTATLTLASPVYPSVFFYTWAPGFAVTVMEGPNVGQQRRLLAVTGEDNTTMVVNAPFDPPLTPLDYLSVNGYKGGYTLEGNRYFNATTLQVFGGLANSVFSGNSIDNMFASGKAVPPLPPMGSDMGGLAGGGGMQYAVSYQQELYNTWELNDFRCFDEFLISVFNFDHPSDNVPVERKNATFNFAQVYRGNSFMGIEKVNFRWTQDHVIEHNSLAPAFCTFINATVAPTINVSSTNLGVVYRE